MSSGHQTGLPVGWCQPGPRGLGLESGSAAQQLNDLDKAVPSLSLKCLSVKWECDFCPHP